MHPLEHIFIWRDIVAQRYNVGTEKYYLAIASLYDSDSDLVNKHCRWVKEIISSMDPNVVENDPFLSEGELLHFHAQEITDRCKEFKNLDSLIFWPKHSEDDLKNHPYINKLSSKIAYRSWFLQYIGGLKKDIVHAVIEEVRGMNAVVKEPLVLDDFVKSLRVAKDYVIDLGDILGDMLKTDPNEVSRSLEIARSTTYSLYGNLGKAEVYAFRNLINRTRTWKRISEGIAVQNNVLKN